MMTDTPEMIANDLTPKERLAIPRQGMPARPAGERTNDFGEVNQGYDEAAAITEAQRCLQCKKPFCIDGCPVNIDIPAFVGQVAEGDFLGAVATIRIDNSLPAVCGRVCPQENQCEGVCVLAGRTEPLAIGHLERFVADYERAQAAQNAGFLAPNTGRKVAIIGSGPAGLACATDLAHAGHQVTVFEALHDFGGVLLYGIPEFRLPKSILNAEIDALRAQGVQFVKNTVIGRTVTIDEILSTEGFDAAFIGTGAGLPWFMDIPGENLNGVYTANEYLTRVNLMKGYDFPANDTPVHVADTSVVIGGGNTAMDAVRTAKRIGAKRAVVVYRRSREEMPARYEEICHAEEEGIEFQFLTSPVRYLDDGNGWMKGVECLKMELGAPDSSGRRKPIPIKDSEFVIEAQQSIVAVGAGSNPLIAKTTPGLAISRHGHINIDERTGRTSKDGVYAGGDIVSGGATVILAMGEGRTAAKAIHQYIMS